MSSIADTIQNLFIVRSDLNLKLNLSFLFAIGMQTTLREYVSATLKLIHPAAQKLIQYPYRIAHSNHK